MTQRLVLRRLFTLPIIALVAASCGLSSAQSAGTLTLRKVLADRPGMQTYTDRNGLAHQIKEDDDIFIAAAALLSNDGDAGAVLWNSAPPDKQCETADHQLATPTQQAFIRIGTVEKCNQKAGQPLSFEWMWHELFYELFNIQNDPAFMRAYQDALHGKYSECEYTVESTRLEYLAEVKLSDFYKRVFAPWAAAHGYPSDETYWTTTILPTYEKWIAQYKDPKSYPWDYWGAYFNQYIVPYLNQAKTPVPTRTCTELASTSAIQAPTNPAMSAATANINGNDYLAQKDYSHAFTEFMQACNGGNAGGCQNLGALFADGLGVAQDYGRASQLYKQACDGGGMKACDLLGDFYKTGYGVVQDRARALQLYDQACKNGFNKACQDRDALKAAPTK